MSDSLDRSTRISLLKEPVLKKLCEVLDKSSYKGWRKLGEIVGSERRFKVRYRQTESDLDYEVFYITVRLFLD